MSDKNLKISIKSDADKEFSKITDSIKKLRNEVSQFSREMKNTVSGVKELGEQITKLSQQIGQLNLGGGSAGGGPAPRNTGSPGAGSSTPGPGAASSSSGLAIQISQASGLIKSMERDVESLKRRFDDLGRSTGTFTQSIGSASSYVGQLSGSGIGGQRFLPMNAMSLYGRGRGGGGGSTIDADWREIDVTPRRLQGRSGMPLLGSGAGGGALPPMSGGMGGMGMGMNFGGLASFLMRGIGWGAVLGNLKSLALGEAGRDISWEMQPSKATDVSLPIGQRAASLYGGDALSTTLATERATGGGSWMRSGFDKKSPQKLYELGSLNAKNQAASNALNIGNIFDMPNAGSNYALGTMTNYVTAKGKEQFAAQLDAASRSAPEEDAMIRYMQSQSGGRTKFARTFGKEFDPNPALGAGPGQDTNYVMSVLASVLSALNSSANISKLNEVVSKSLLTLPPEAVKAALVAQGIGGGDPLGVIYGSQLSNPMRASAIMAASSMNSNSLLRLNKESNFGAYTAFGASTDSLDISRLSAGTGILNNLGGPNASPYFQMSSVMGAVRPGMSIYSTSVLSRASTTDLIDIKNSNILPKEYEHMNITMGDVRSELNSRFAAPGRAAIIESSKTMTPAVKAILALNGDYLGAADRIKQGLESSDPKLREAAREEESLLDTGLTVLTPGGTLTPGAAPFSALVGTANNKKGAVPTPSSGLYGAPESSKFIGQRHAESPGSLPVRVGAAKDVGAASSPNFVEKIGKEYGDLFRTDDPEAATKSVAILTEMGVGINEIAKGGNAVKVLKGVNEQIEITTKKIEDSYKRMKAVQDKLDGIVPGEFGGGN